MHFQPLEDEVKELKRRCTVGGVCFAEVGWDPVFDCLCIYEMGRAGNWTVRTPLVDEKGFPRQIHRGDVNEMSEAIYGNRDEVDNYYRDLKAREANRKDQAARIRRERILEAIEMQRQYNGRSYGRNKSADPLRTTRCSHGEWYYQCGRCSPEKAGRQMFFQGSKSGAATNGAYHIRES